MPLRILAAFSCLVSLASAQHAEELDRFKAPEATQAVAVDGECIYAIANSVIGKYNKRTGERVGEWRATDALPLRHLNSGVVHNGQLYCCNSNFPDHPETSSLEIFDPQSMRHVGTHSFGIYEGSLTWVDRQDGAWWACFAHYSERVNDDPLAKPHTYTSLVKFDDHWRRTAGWVFPQEVLDRFAPHSCSGGGWGPDDALYATGHDRGELYLLELPKAGSTLVLTDVIKLGITGQGVAWDKSQPGVICGIRRPTREVTVWRVGE